MALGRRLTGEKLAVILSGERLVQVSISPPRTRVLISGSDLFGEHWVRRLKRVADHFRFTVLFLPSFLHGVGRLVDPGRYFVLVFLFCGVSTTCTSPSRRAAEPSTCTAGRQHKTRPSASSAPRFSPSASTLPQPPLCQGRPRRNDQKPSAEHEPSLHIPSQSPRSSTR